MTLVIVLSIALALFALAFLTKRRFGVLGLGLAAGAILAQSWARELGAMLATYQVPVAPLGYITAAAVALTLVPALILLIAGPTYGQRRYAIIGSTLFALLGTMLLLGPLTLDLPTLDKGVKPALDFVAQWQNLLIAIGIALAVLDMLHAHGSKFPGRKHSKH